MALCYSVLSLIFLFFIDIVLVTNLTAQTEYEISAWAKSSYGESSVAFEHFTTKGTRPTAPSLKAKVINQTAVECSWADIRNVVRIHYILCFFCLDHVSSSNHIQICIHNSAGSIWTS